jgi:1,4-alpha-glucan branching enzyme
LICDLNRLYASEAALYRCDTEARGFRWVIGDDVTNSVFAFLRLADEGVSPILCVCNMTSVVRHDYRIGVPCAGTWEEIFNSDSHLYAGSNQGNGGAVVTEFISAHGEQQSVCLVLPPLAVLLLKHGA